jgi:peptidase E
MSFYQFINLSGGNTFRFLKSIKERGAESRLVEYARNGGILIGVSAGAMILTPSIESAFICGDVNTVGLSDLEGLELVSFFFDPHSSKQDTNLVKLKGEFDLLRAEIGVRSWVVIHYPRPDPIYTFSKKVHILII